MIYRNSKIRKNPNNNNNMYPWLVDTIYYCYPDLTYTVILFFTSNRINHFSCCSFIYSFIYRVFYNL